MSLPMGWRFVLLLSCVTLLGTRGISAGEKSETGHELFSHQWRQNDPRSPQGDGLGPMFNDVSCVACHQQGGVGGGGPVEKNVQVGSVFAGGLDNAEFARLAVGEQRKEAASQQRAELETIHPGFLKSRSVVLHRSSTDEAYREFHAKNFTHKPQVNASAILALLGGKANPLASVAAATKVVAEAVNEGSPLDPDLTKEQLAEIARLKQLAPSRLTRRDFREVSLLISERNTTALFGSGLIEAIPDAALKRMAGLEHHAYPEVSGRVARSASGRVGRFGWKGQQAKLHDFVLAACATEVGLQVPTRSQGMLPHQPDYKSPGLDLTADECLALTAFIAELPNPRQQARKDKESSIRTSEGSNLFGAIGCAVCHSSDVGQVSGIYSDLLLHDMGPGLSDPGEPGAYGGSEDDDARHFPLPPVAGDFGIPAGEGDVRVGLVDALRGDVAGPQEWRTPPLWGVRDSAPYLHDGRAETIEQAIAWHAGEAKRSMGRYFQLSADQRTQLLTFLGTLAAPE
jgi:CxxC motif-containing protein (DUF1111 family)